MSEPRYFVDQRGGCIAVRDRTLTDPDYQGLHSYTPGVVWYEHGEMQTEECPTCKCMRDRGWHLSEMVIRQAHEECARLNREQGRLANEAAD